MKQKIEERDEQIGKKEKQIYILKKKTQELEKFKFVLDYKIKELRKMIAPRQTEITALRKETREMDAKLKNYNTMNSNLGFMVEDLRNRQEAMQDSIKQNRLKRMYNDILISKMKTDVYWTVQHIDDFEALQKVVNQRLYKHVRDSDPKNVEVDVDIKKEQENQRRYLENTKASLNKRLEKEQQIHKTENSRIMWQNLELINQIKKLRNKINEAREWEKQQRNKAKMLQNQSAIGRDSRAANQQRSDPELFEAMEQERMQERQRKQMEIRANHNHLLDLQNRLMNAKQENQFLGEEMQPHLMGQQM